MEYGVVDLAPDWVCEIVSQGHERKDRVQLPLLLLRHRVPFYWLIWPEEPALVAHELDGDGYRVIATVKDPGKARVPPFDHHYLLGLTYAAKLEIDLAVNSFEVAFVASDDGGSDLPRQQRDTDVVVIPGALRVQFACLTQALANLAYQPLCGWLRRNQASEPDETATERREMLDLCIAASTYPKLVQHRMG